MTTHNGTPTPADAARFHLKLGQYAVPNYPRTKRPVGEDWEKLRITEKDIERLFRPENNVGLLVGKPSGGLVDVDLDCSEAVAVATILLPATGMICGRESAPTSHWWFLVDDPPEKSSDGFDDPTINDSDSPRCKLLELRSTGGQTIVPPSVYGADPKKGHPTEEQCVWYTHGEPAKALIEELKIAVREVAAASLISRYWPKGGRNAAALALAGGLLRAGWKEERVETFIRAVCKASRDEEVKNRVDCVRHTAERLAEGNKKATGWPALAKAFGERGQTIVGKVCEWLGIQPSKSSSGSAYIGSGSRSSNNPQSTPPSPPPQIPPYVPFPTELLPPILRAYVEAIASAMNCDESYTVLPSLAALGAAIGVSHVASPKNRWKEPPYVWALTIGKSGAIKSPPYRDVEDMAEDINDRLEKDYEAEMLEYEAELAAWEEAKHNDDEAGPKPKQPVKKAFIKGDVTIEALVGALQNNPRGLFIGQDELSAWIGGFVKYSGKTGTSDLPRWLQLHHAGTINYTRKTGDPDKREVRVRGVGVSVTGTIQPKVLSRVLTEEFRASGFLARLLLAMPPWRKRQWTEAEIDDSIREPFAGLLSDLSRLPRGKWPNGNPAPHLIRLSDEAKEMFVAFYNANGAALEVADEDMSAVMSKLEGYSLRFALIFHCCRLKENAKDVRIAASDMTAAIKLTTWFRDEAERVYMALAEPVETQNARQLAETIRKLAERFGGRVTPRQLQRFNCRKYPTSATGEATLHTLVGLGFGRWEDIAASPNGGASSRAYVPCMTHDTTPTEEDDESPANESKETGVHDTTPEKGFPGSAGVEECVDATPQESGNCNSACHSGVEVVSCVSCVMQSGGSSETDPGPPPQTPDQFCHANGVVSCTDPEKAHGNVASKSQPFLPRLGYRVIASEGGLSDVVSAIEDDGGMVGLDTETTGLNPARDRVRMLQLATIKGTYLIDLFALPNPATDLAELFQVTARNGIIGHNLAFDLPFLMRLGFVPDRVFDTMLASQVLHAGEDFATKHGLKDLVSRHLGLTLDKEQQDADWSGPLTPEMVQYAARDAEILIPIRQALIEQAKAAKLSNVLDIEMKALSCIAWASVLGVGFDRPAWETIAAETIAERERLREQLDTIAPSTHDLFGARNWDSPEQVQSAFADKGITLKSTDDDALAAINHPLAALVREYRSVAKRASSYGLEWLRHVQQGRVYANWKQIGAGASGRMSCKEPNLQQLPRDVRYRRCFVAPPGRVLVKADYSQIELRIAAKIAKDQRMLDAYQNGEDLHTLTARALLGKQDVAKADRQLAKAINFGLLYGMGAPALKQYALSNYGVSLTDQEALQHRNTFFRTYRGLRKWHQSMPNTAMDTRTLAGRRRGGVKRYTEKLNTPVQGTGADGLKRAIALLWERRAECPGAFPVLFVHDEIVVECDVEQAEQVKTWLVNAMKDGMSPLVDPVPVEVEATIGTTWGGDPSPSPAASRQPGNA